MALRQFCQEGKLKWVCLLIWAGANPRSRGPALDDADHGEDPEWHTTALNEASASGNVKLLKRLGANSSDDLAGMLERAAYSARPDVLAYLLDLGAKPNDKPDGGSTALESCIRHLGWEDFDRVRYGYGPTYQSPAHKVSNGRAAVKLLLQHGAIWKPQPSTMNDTRRILYRLEPEVTVELVGHLLETANGESGVRELLRVPRMRQHLPSCASQLSRLGLTLDGQRRSSPPVAQPQSAPASAQYDRERLFEDVWSEPMKDLGCKYGMSEAALSTLCTKLEIPTPPKGHWARKTAAQAQALRPRLLPLGFRKSRS
jgi:hypothetical protein